MPVESIYGSGHYELVFDFPKRAVAVRVGAAMEVAARVVEEVVDAEGLVSVDPLMVPEIVVVLRTLEDVLEGDVPRRGTLEVDVVVSVVARAAVSAALNWKEDSV